MNWKPFDSLTTHSAFRRYYHPDHSSWYRRISAARICNSRKRDTDNGKWTRTVARELTPARCQSPELQSTRYGSPAQDIFHSAFGINQNLFFAYLSTDCFISASETYSSRLSLCYILPMFVERLLAAHFNRRQIRIWQEPKAKSSCCTTATCKFFFRNEHCYTYIDII